jgi:hypothetical protein
LISALDIGWAAGFIEGEGCFDFSKTSSCRVRVSQIQRAPLDKLVELFGGSIWVAKRYVNRHGPQVVWTWTAYGQTAAGLAMTLWPLLSPNRRTQINKMLALWRAVLPWKRYRAHCPQGHAYTAENTRIRKSARGTSRYCRTCNNSS